MLPSLSNCTCLPISRSLNLSDLDHTNGRFGARLDQIPAIGSFKTFIVLFFLDDKLIISIRQIYTDFAVLGSILDCLLESLSKDNDVGVGVFLRR